MITPLFRWRLGLFLAFLLGLWLVGVLWMPAWQDGSLRYSPRLLTGGLTLLGICLVVGALLNYYEPKKLLRTATIRWYVPRAVPLPCP